MRPPNRFLAADISLISKTKLLKIVSAQSEDGKFVGVLNCRVVRRQLSAEVLSQQQKADNIHSLHKFRR